MRAFSTDNRKALITILAIALLALTGGYFTIAPNVGDPVTIAVPAPDDNDSGGDDDSALAGPPTTP